MSNGVLPPVPDLIPISVLRRNSPANNNTSNSVERAPEKCTPCASIRSSEVMGEQRSRRRTANQHPVELIDNAGSRGSSAAPQAPHSRKARSERHRKSDRRREHRKPARSRSDSKHSKSRETLDSTATSPERPVNPRVNPIFVWVRQEDTYIVDVKCEDYDKRNRILLTKTAQGWRAIPRTETLVPSLKEAASKEQQQTSSSHHHHHHHKNKKSRKNKVRRRSTGVQVCSDIDQDETPEEQESEEIESEIRSTSSPAWMSSDNVNVESLLPSHTIKVKRSTSPDGSPERETNVNSVVREAAQTPALKCSADKICDVTPLDNLLAVAELEFNQQLQSGEWNKTTQIDMVSNEDAIDSYTKTINDVEDPEHKEFIKNLEQLNDLIESEENKLELQSEFETNEQKSDECDYTEEDDNNLAMDDILSRLEQSLRSPDGVENANCDTNFQNKNVEEEEDEEEEEEDDDEEEEEDDEEEVIKNIDNFITENDNDFKSIPDLDKYFEENDPKVVNDSKIEIQKETENPEATNIVESSTADDDEQSNQPTDLSVKSIPKTLIENNNCDDILEEPTDLSMPKISSITISLSPRPPSQNSEAIQSPQPSGIPAVPQSPDIVSTSVTTTSNVNTKPKSVFLESLLSNSSKKIPLNSEVTIIRQNEPLDLGKSRKSASPTVTCSEEVNSTPSEMEPPAKKFKSVDITLKHLLGSDVPKLELDTKNNDKSSETPRLLELLKTDVEPDPLTQLKQLLADPNVNIPDPMLVPKDKFSAILTNPATEIPKLLKDRPELRLPEALVFPHIMQDPNMLVLNTHHLESILTNKSSDGNTSTTPTEKIPETISKRTERAERTEKLNEKARESPKKRNSEHSSKSNATSETQTKNFSELASDIDAATQAAFNQMMWLPYLNHLEAMSVNNNTELMKMFANSFPQLPFYPNQISDFSHMFNSNRFPSTPVGFPFQPPMNYGNPLEVNMWQEAMMQANMLRNKANSDNFNNKHLFKDYTEKINVPTNRKQPVNNMNSKMHVPNKQHNFPNMFYPNGHSYQNPYSNMTSYQSNNSQKAIQMPPQFNPGLQQKNIMNQQRHNTSFSQKSFNGYMQSQKMDNSIFSQLTDQERNQYLQSLNNLNHEQYQREFMNSQRKETNSHPTKPKLACKSFANLSSQVNQKPVSLHDSQQKEKNCEIGKHQTTSQPIDLSGSTTSSGSKLKVKQHLIDPVNTPKLLKHHDDVPEVGSTTASVEEMQDAHKHLWHPLFGNQKGYTSPWNWTTVTATGE